MKNYLRILSVVFAMLISVALMTACGISGGTENSTNVPQNNVENTEANDVEVTEPFVAPADQVGKVLSADNQLITWYPYEVKEETLNFKGLKVDELGEEGEMSLLYLEKDVTYYLLVNGKLEKTTVESVVKDSVVGVTTLEEGVQEVYILSVPVEEEEEYEEVVLEEDDT